MLLSKAVFMAPLLYCLIAVGHRQVPIMPENNGNLVTETLSYDLRGEEPKTDGLHLVPTSATGFHVLRTFEADVPMRAQNVCIKRLIESEIGLVRFKTPFGDAWLQPGQEVCFNKQGDET